MKATASAPGSESTVEGLKAISDGFEGASPDVVLYWAAGEFGDEVALATGFGAEGCVLIDMLARVAPRMRVFYLDTDLLFPETYQLAARLSVRYGVRFERRATRLTLAAQAKAHGERLWERDPEECCRLRKVEPLRETLKGLRAWVTAIRREQSPARAGAGVVERDAKFGLVKVNPLAAWSARDVWDYILKNDVPYNPLHDLNYASVGCVPCTTPVRIGEDPRAGRWRGTAKTECGLHR
ncbi:MAG: phosphoadenylyl-sulfate reductase [Pyrinomonadaceae bacterium]